MKALRWTPISRISAGSRALKVRGLSASSMPIREIRVTPGSLIPNTLPVAPE